MSSQPRSPARSQGARTPRRLSSRNRRSVGSPARSTTSGRLSTLVEQFKDQNMDSFALSPAQSHSVLSDNTQIEEPRRKSWWKKLNDNSREVLIEAMSDNHPGAAEDIVEELEVEILSQEKKNFTLDLPDSSGSESISSIVIPQRKLFTHKENVPSKKNFGKIVGRRDSVAKVNKTKIYIQDNVGPKKLFGQATTQKTLFPKALDTSANKTFSNEPKAAQKKLFGQASSKKSIFPTEVAIDLPRSSVESNAPRKNLFQHEERKKTVFPAGLLEMSPNKTTNKTLGGEVKGQVRSLFGQPGIKRKNMFADFIASESEDEMLEIQPRVFGFQNKAENKRLGTSTSLMLPDEDDDWKLLPSSTMMELQATPVKKPKLSRITQSEKEKSRTTNSTKMNKSKDKTTEAVRKDPSPSLSKSVNEIEKMEQDDENGENDKSSIKAEKTQEEVEDQESENEEEAEESVEVHNSTAVEVSQDEAMEDEENDEEVEQDDEDIEKNEEEVEQDDEDIEENEEEVEQDDEEIEENGEDVEQAAEVIEQNYEQEEEDGVEIEQSDKEVEQTDEEMVQNDDAELDNEAIHRESDQIKQNIEEESHIEQVKENEIVVIKQVDELHRETVPNVSQSKKVEKQLQLSRSQSRNLNKSQTSVPVNKSLDINKLEGSVHQSNLGDSVLNDQDESLETNYNTYEHDYEANKSESKITDELPMEINQSIRETEDHSVLQDDEDEAMELTYEDENQSDAQGVENIHRSNREVEESIEQNYEQENEEQEQNENELEQEETKETETEEQMEVNMSQQKENDSESEPENEEDQQAEVSQLEEDNEAESEEEEVSVQAEELEEDSNEKIEEEDAEESEQEQEVDQSVEQEDSEPEQEEDLSDAEMDNGDGEVIDEENRPSVSEIEASPNVTHDTTGRNRKLNSPEAMRQNNANNSLFDAVRARNTSIRKTKSMVQPNIEPSLRISGVTNSSAEGSGWDSHRITKKTIRQTFGKGFTPRKSLRALVMEKSAQRQTFANEVNNAESIRIPQANSTEIGQVSMPFEDEENDAPVHDVSRRTRQTTLEMYLQKVKKDTLERKKKMEIEVRNNLKARQRDINVYNNIQEFATRKPKTQIQPKPKKVKPSAVPLGEIPAELLVDMKTKPPKRFAGKNASWITKRLYKFLEAKLEPKYDYKARVKAEQLVETIYNFTTYVRRHDAAPRDAVRELRAELARRRVVRTHHDFYEFFHAFMPREIRIKVVPDIVNNLKMPRDGVFAPIVF